MKPIVVRFLLFAAPLLLAVPFAMLAHAQGGGGTGLGISAPMAHGPQSSPNAAPYAPPASRWEHRPHAPWRGAGWVEGHWAWQSNHYIWVAGKWDHPPRAGAYWHRGFWDHRGNAWVWVDGHW